MENKKGVLIAGLVILVGIVITVIMFSQTAPIINVEFEVWLPEKIELNTGIPFQDLQEIAKCDLRNGWYASSKGININVEIPTETQEFESFRKLQNARYFIQPKISPPAFDGEQDYAVNYWAILSEEDNTRLVYSRLVLKVPAYYFYTFRGGNINIKTGKSILSFHRNNVRLIALPLIFSVFAVFYLYGEITRWRNKEE